MLTALILSITFNVVLMLKIYRIYQALNVKPPMAERIPSTLRKQAI